MPNTPFGGEPVPSSEDALQAPGEVPSSPAASMTSPERLPPWCDADVQPRNADFSTRVVMLPNEDDWQPSSHDGLEIRVLEYTGDDSARLTAQLRVSGQAVSAALGSGADIELLVQAGDIEAGDNVWPSGLYVRLPAAGPEVFESLELSRASTSVGSGASEGSEGSAETAGGDAADGADEVNASRHEQTATALLYVATGHIDPKDTEQRRIDTRDASHWLPGPVEGTEVFPLHGHGSANIMLIRWLGAVAFRPGLDPLGEEILVLEGSLHDALGTYPSGSWIRNPVPAWQSWSGEPGTLIYYKNGHFAKPEDNAASPDPLP